MLSSNAYNKLVFPPQKKFCYICIPVKRFVKLFFFFCKIIIFEMMSRFCSISQGKQVHDNIRNGNTGQLSTVSIFLQHLSSVGRLVTSVIDIHDNLMIVCFAHACLWNTIVTCQMVYYRRQDRRRRLQAKTREKRSSSDSDSTSDESASDGDCRPRRRRYSSFSTADRSA